MEQPSEFWSFDFTGNKKGRLLASSLFTESDIYTSDVDSDATLVYSCDDDAPSPLVELSPLQLCKKRSFKDFEVINFYEYFDDFEVYTST